MRLLCRLFGHRWDIKGLTGRYEWCQRCADRREVAPRKSRLMHKVDGVWTVFEDGTATHQHVEGQWVGIANGH